MERSTSDFIDLELTTTRNMKGMKLKEVKHFLETDESCDVEAICIEAPEPAVISDEDSAEEDESDLIDDMSSCRQEATAHIQRHPLHDKEEVTHDFEDTPKYKKRKQQDFSWKKEDLFATNPIFPDANYMSHRNLTPIQIFEQIIDDKVIQLIINETSKYGFSKNHKDINISVEELKVFFAILFLSGYNTVPSVRCYWEARLDMRNELVVNAMRRDRFLEILRFIHFADNTNIDTNDKMFKLRPLINLIKKRFMNLFQPEENLNFNESMVEYGKHGCKPSIRGKPIRLGYKVLCLNTPSGYLLDFEIYQGKNPNSDEVNDIELGNAAAPLLKMLGHLPEDKKVLAYKLYFANLFTNTSLLTHLRESGYNGTEGGENRVAKNFFQANFMNKQEKEYVEQACSKDNIAIAKWLDNASKCHGSQSENKVSCNNGQQKEVMSEPQPSLRNKHNKLMGGTDLMEQNLGCYKIGIRGKKWYWPIFTWLLDVAMVNSWIVMRKTGNNISQIEFRRYIVTTYLEKYRNPPVGSGRPSTLNFSNISVRVPDDIRLDNVGHLVGPCNRRRCCAVTCKSTVRTECIKCQVGLCINCFVHFHTK